MSIKTFADRHIGVSPSEEIKMLETIGVASLDALIEKTLPPSIRSKSPLNLSSPLSEFEYLKHIQSVSEKNVVAKNYIGQGYYGTITPSVILRNVFENPGWYTQYTPYQAEISQGRLEALLNFQTMISDLTAMPIANASLLDEATAAAEAMNMFFAAKTKKNKHNKSIVFLVSDSVFQQTIDVLITRAKPLGIKVEICSDLDANLREDVFGLLVQYPNAKGKVEDFSGLISNAKSKEIYTCVAADILSLCILTPPGEWGTDVVLGNTQRFGIPMGFGGPHAAYFATTEEFKRIIPGRIIGVSQDAEGNRALRMALQTREQHIRREKATSNICTAQALLAIMAGFYAAYHGPEGLKSISTEIHKKAIALKQALVKLDYTISDGIIFDTVEVLVPKDLLESIKKLSESTNNNFWFHDNGLLISIDETHSHEDLIEIINIFEKAKNNITTSVLDIRDFQVSLDKFERKSAYLTHPIFNQNHTESQMMRYIKRLENKDLSLVHSMISLGSCTMKLNAATELIPLSWGNFANIHPFAPYNQTLGYTQMVENLAKDLCEITGLEACSFQPNSGAQGEYTGLLTINAYLEDKNESHRKIALIPASAHGTNPASAVMAGMNVVVVACDDLGNIDIEDLKAKIETHKENLACLMVTYPSTHGVFEDSIIEICAMIHAAGGLVYMDGANMNAQVGLTSPGLIGADVCHLNLHKTFAIPHGGGGPGMGPICVNSKLAPYLPNHCYVKTGGSKAISSVSASPYSSTSILLISYGYIKMLGAEGLTNSTKYAILNANYIKSRLEKYYSVYYQGKNGTVAHEMIIDINPFKVFNIQAEDIAKRLMDYGFHAPTMSFPVAGTLMVEPTESESLDELDRFCDAMISIKKEIEDIEQGKYPKENNVLTNAPHTQYLITEDEWPFPYSRQKAAFPLPYLKEGYKFWPSVRRVDNAFGDRNLVCTCPPLSDYE
ncbi:MAG: aminomethyl-transferring glycine dehydrogenase [Saprospiraceae bacterium]|nr:aminomethyl-transferring glycine dehydrogenase [Saprospiraceae bacterium]